MSTTTTHPAPTIFTCPYCEHKNELTEVSEGEVITCANPMCGRQFQAELPKVAPDPELIVPHEAMASAHEENAVSEQPPASAPRPAEEPIIADAPVTGTTVAAPEMPTVVATYRPPMLPRHPLRFVINVGLVLLGLAGLLGAYLWDSTLLGAMSLLPLVFGAARQFAWWMRAHNSVLTVTTRGIVVTDGLFTVHSREIYHETIHGIHIFQPWWNRLTHTGALMIDFGGEGEKMYLDAVWHPHRIAEQIREQAKK